jgi:hypothetical protein
MGMVCLRCGASNPEGEKSCRTCGHSLACPTRSSRHTAQGGGQASSGPWIAAVCIVVLVLCCFSLVGMALLDELMPSHPWRTLVMGTSTLTATVAPIPTFGPAVTPAPTPAEGADAFEPDDTMDQASPIEIDGPAQTHNLKPPDDRDYLSFEVSAGTRYTVETGNLGADCDTFLTLYDEDGIELTHDDDGGEEELASRVSWTAQQGGVFFAEVRAFDEEAEGVDTEYDVWVSESEVVALEPDEYEPDNVMENAAELRLGVPQKHTIHLPGDRDWLRFQVEKGSSYVIETSDLRGGLDTVIQLYDETGVELATNDDGSGEDLSSRITWAAVADGTLFVMVRDLSEEVVDSEMEYTVSVRESEPLEPDAYEPDDSQEGAGEIQVGVPQRHNLHVTGDHDWTCFQAVGGTNYVMETFNLGDRIDTYLALYDAAGELLAEDDDSGSEGLASLVQWRSTESATLCLLVQDLRDEAAGPETEYSVSVLEEGAVRLFADPYEPDDTMTSAGSIGIGEVQGHNIHAVGDHDWLSFQAEAGLTYLVETYHLGDEVDTVLLLYNEKGEELAGDDDGGDEPRASRVAWTAQTAGTVYVMVRDYKDDRADRSMTYDISVYESGGGLEGSRSGVYIGDGAYHIVTVEPNHLVVGVSERLSLDSFSLEVDAVQVSGDDDNEYGLICAYQDDDNYYELGISGDGFVGFFAKEDGNWSSISDFASSDAVHQGNALNHLRLEVDEGSFSFYVNGRLVLQESDYRFGEGLIGFGCGSFLEPGLHCSFDDLRVWDAEGTLVWEEDFDDNSGAWYQSPTR